MVAIVLLAAGMSSRLGHPKQLVEYKGKTLLRNAVDEALNSMADKVFVVLGSKADEMVEQLEDLNVVLVKNDNFEKGMGSSLKAGMKAIQDLKPETNAVVFMPCDQPYLTTEVLNELIVLHEKGNKIVASEYKSVLGIPVLFDKQYFDAIMEIEDKAGAKSIIEDYDVECVVFEAGAIDIDTPEDLNKLKEKE